MSSYFRPGDKITLSQTDVEISAENGLEFQENQTIGIYIPPNVRFFSGKETLLSFDVKIQTGTQRPETLLQLDGTIGGQSLFNRARVYAGNRSQLIEELDEYSTSVMIKYSYEANDTIRNKRALTEGCGAWVPECRGTCGSHKTGQSNVISNPYFEKRFKGSNRLIGAGLGDSDSNINANKFQTCHIEMPLHLGCFANNSKAFPNVLTDGLYLELTCAPGRQVFRSLDSVTLNRQFANLPRFNGVQTIDTSAAADDVITKIFIDPGTNMNVDAQHCPFSVGEEIGIYDSATDIPISFDVTGTNLPPRIKNITSVDDGAGKHYIQLELADADGRTCKVGAAAITSDSTFWVFSNSLKTAVAAEKADGTWIPKYTISNVNLKVHRIDVGSDYEAGMMNKMKSGGVIEFDIPSVQCHKNSILKSDKQATMNINIDHHKAKSIICVPTDAALHPAEDVVTSTNTYEWLAQAATLSGRQKQDNCGLAGCGNFLKEYNLSLAGMLVPSRPVSVAKSADPGNGSIAGPHILELEKALTGAGIRPMSFIDYKKNFIIGRALAMDANTIYNGIGIDTRLLLQYEGGTDGTRVDTLWKNFVYHIKTISIKGEGISILH